MALHDIVVIGGSSGSLQPLETIVGMLPDDLAACVLIVVHTRTTHESLLPQILARRTKLCVTFAREHAPVIPGHVYVAPPDHHLLVTAAGLRVVHGPRENGFRPAIDPMFRTAARTFGERVVGVVLSGALGDGAYGLSVIKHHGGVAIVQDPADAQTSSMPKTAMASVDVDHVVPAADIARLIETLSQEPAPQGEEKMARTDDLEPQLPSEETSVADMQERFGAPSSLTCPDCGGALWEVEDGRLVRYQCHTGHQYSPEALDDEQRNAVDSALWSAVRVLEEHAELKNRLARRAASTGLNGVAEGFKEGARDSHGQAQQIRSVLFSTSSGSAGAVGTTQRAVAARRTPRTRRKVRRAARKT